MHQCILPAVHDRSGFFSASLLFSDSKHQISRPKCVKIAGHKPIPENFSINAA